VISAPSVACTSEIGTTQAEIVAFALEEGMLLDVKDDVEVSGLAAEGAGFAEAGDEADARSIFDARGDFGFD